MGTPSGAVIYVRVSSEEQGRGASLESQETSCRRYCAERGDPVLAVYTDTTTGTTLDRPGLTAAFDAVASLRPATVVLHDVDRLGREFVVQAIAERELTRHGARLAYVLGGTTDDGSGILLKGVKQALAVYENYQRVERVRRGKDGRVQRGEVLVAARPAYGYVYIGGKRTGRLEPHPQEAPVVRDIFRWSADEGLTCYAIAQRLHDLEIPSRADTANGVVAKKDGHGTWNPHTIKKLLHNETYKGDWHWNKTRRVRRDDRIVQEPRPRAEWLSLPVPPLVDDRTWARAQERLTTNKRLPTPPSGRVYLLRGLIFCPSCGRRWYARHKADIGRTYYRCPSAKAEHWAPADCQIRFSLEQTRIETAVLDAVKAFLLDPEVRAAGVAAEQERVATERARAGDDLAATEQTLATVDRKLSALLDQALTDGFPADLLDRRKRELLADRERTLGEREQALARLADVDGPDLEAAIAALSPIVETAFSAAQPSDLRRLLDVLRIEVHVIDRDTVRLTGVIAGTDGSVVGLSSWQKAQQEPAPFSLVVPLPPAERSRAA